VAYLTRSQVLELGFAACGDDVLISDRCSIYGAAGISLGDHVRIDDMTVITAEAPVTLGSYVHIGPQVFLSGTHGLHIGDFTSLAAGTKVYSISNDYSGEVMAAHGVPAELQRFDTGAVNIAAYVNLGASCVVLPGVTIEEGVAVGALSLVKDSLAAWSIYGGVPAHLLRRRSRQMLSIADDFLRAQAVARPGA
jgi:acetyltransferase-like isoleucine patch superfamily enzyme